MIEKMEAKIEAYIKSILDKNTITYEDYQALSSEYVRLHMIEEAKKVEAEKAATAERMKQVLESMTMCGVVK